jgi:hypothetical protein
MDENQNPARTSDIANLTTFEPPWESRRRFMLKPLVASVTVCDPRHNKLIEDGNKSDDEDAETLAQLLRLGAVNAPQAERRSRLRASARKTKTSATKSDSPNLVVASPTPADHFLTQLARWSRVPQSHLPL